jgi:hypothetical protein
MDLRTGGGLAGWRGILVAMAMSWCGLATDAEAKVFKLYYLGGQSNMDGYGRNADLPAELQEPIPDVMIFHGNPAADGVAVDGRGIWSGLRPGHGAGFQSDGTTNQYSERFGVELSFARRLRELDPETPIALIKYSRGGTSIDVAAAGSFGCWDPDFSGGMGPGRGINQYDHFLATIRGALAVRDIDGDGEDDVLIPAGILWMQGESDATVDESVARRYESHLKRLIDLIRASLRADDLPVAIGRISDSGKGSPNPVWKHGELVRAAQMAYASKDGFAAIVTSTDKYAYSDPWHYNSAGFLDLGFQFAEAISKIPPPRSAQLPRAESASP